MKIHFFQVQIIPALMETTSAFVGRLNSETLTTSDGFLNTLRLKAILMYCVCMRHLMIQEIQLQRIGENA